MLLIGNRSARVLQAAIILFVAACGDGGTGPSGLADPAAATAKMQALDDAFDVPAYASFQLAGANLPVLSASFQVLATKLRTVQSPTRDVATRTFENRRALDALRKELAVRRSASASESILPPEVLGKTFEWNSSTTSYAATTRAGAPANGVRLILYTLGGNGLPLIPLQEFGYADFKDESDVSTSRLHSTVVVGGTTYLDYTLASRFTSAPTFSYSSSIAGFVLNGTRRLDFSWTDEGNDIGSTSDTRYDLNAENVHIRSTQEVLNLSQTSVRIDLDETIQVGSEVIISTGSVIITFDGTSLSVTGSATINVNGKDFATVTFTGDPATPAYTAPGGGTLAADQRDALIAIFDALGQLFLRLLELRFFII